MGSADRPDDALRWAAMSCFVNSCSRSDAWVLARETMNGAGAAMGSADRPGVGTATVSTGACPPAQGEPVVAHQGVERVERHSL